MRINIKTGNSNSLKFSCPNFIAPGPLSAPAAAFRINRELRQKGSRSRIKVRTMAKMFRIIRHRKKQGENIVSVNIGEDVSITI